MWYTNMLDIRFLHLQCKLDKGTVMLILYPVPVACVQYRIPVPVPVQVEYVADENGFHVDASNLPVANPVAHPQVTFSSG
jgi:hypothetical protein